MIRTNSYSLATGTSVYDYVDFDSILDSYMVEEELPCHDTYTRKEQFRHDWFELLDDIYN